MSMPLPALSTPFRVWSDDHLPTVVRVSVIYIQLKPFPFMSFNEGEEIFRLRGRQSQTLYQSSSSSNV
jgi:hypothetical protein